MRIQRKEGRNCDQRAGEGGPLISAPCGDSPVLHIAGGPPTPSMHGSTCAAAAARHAAAAAARAAADMAAIAAMKPTVGVFWICACATARAY